MKKPYPDLPANWFPMSPVTTYWNLDRDDNIEIARRGYPLVPNFSSTIDSATGRTLNSSVPELGGMATTPSFDAAMRGYIALSRVQAVDRLLLARPFSPVLFQQGPQPFPSLLLDVLKGKVRDEDLFTRCEEAKAKYASLKLLKHCTWQCGECKLVTGYSDFISSKGEQWYEDVFVYIIKPGKLRRCKKCRNDLSDSFPCAVCKQLKPKEQFSSSVLHNRSDRPDSFRCIDCSRPQCTARDCTTCRICRDEACNSVTCNGSILPLHVQELRLLKTIEDVRKYVCANCRHGCTICKKNKAKYEFSTSMIHHRSARSDGLRCIDCSRPQCTARDCTTC